MPDDLKQSLDEDLSSLIRKYQQLGLSPEEISDSLSWHEELAQSRSKDGEDERASIQAD